MTISHRNEAEHGWSRPASLGSLLPDRSLGRGVHFDQTHARPLEDQFHQPSVDSSEADSLNSRTQTIAELETVGRVHRYPGRAALFDQGDSARFLYVVLEGRLKLSLLAPRGRRVVIRFAVPGDLLGLSATLNHSGHEFAAQTLDSSVLIRIPRYRFLQLLQSSPALKAFASESLARDHEALLASILRLGLGVSVRARLALLITNLLESARTDHLPASIRINWSNKELANMINSSRETVSRIMGQFEREGYIVRRGSLVVIQDAVGLKRLAS